MIDVNKIKLGDKLRVLCEGLKGLDEIEEVVTVVDYYLGDHGTLWIAGDQVTLEALSEYDEDRFELVKEESGTTESTAWKIQVLTNKHEYQGLYKGSIHVVKTVNSDGCAQFYHNGKLWTLDAEDYEEYVKQPLVVDLFVPKNNGEAKPIKLPIVSDGGSSSYYDLPLLADTLNAIDERRVGGASYIKTEEIVQTIFKNNFSFGTLFKSLIRAQGVVDGAGKAGNDLDYEMNKVIYYANQIKELYGNK